MVSSAKKAPSLTSENLGTITAVEISTSLPMLAPKDRSHSAVTWPAQSGNKMVRASSISLSMAQMRQPLEECTGNTPGLRPKERMRTPNQVWTIKGKRCQCTERSEKHGADKGIAASGVHEGDDDEGC